jgi:hypothetical protein
MMLVELIGQNAAWIVLGVVVIAMAIIVAITAVLQAKAREETKRELFAYVAESSISADDAIALLAAGSGMLSRRGTDPADPATPSAKDPLEEDSDEASSTAIPPLPTSEQAFNLEYWTSFIRYAEEHHPELPVKRRASRMSYLLYYRNHGHWLAPVMLPDSRMLQVHLAIVRPTRYEVYRALLLRKDELERDLGYSLQARDHNPPDSNQCQLYRNFQNCDPANREDWPRQHRLLAEALLDFKRVVIPVVGEIEASIVSAPVGTTN